MTCRVRDLVPLGRPLRGVVVAALDREQSLVQSLGVHHEYLGRARPVRGEHDLTSVLADIRLNVVR